MNARIRKGVNLYELTEYGFYEYKDRMFIKPLSSTLCLMVNCRSRRLYLTTPLGQAAFMEAHRESFQDLLDANMVEFLKSEFDR